MHTFFGFFLLLYFLRFRRKASCGLSGASFRRVGLNVYSLFYRLQLLLYLSDFTLDSSYGGIRVFCLVITTGLFSARPFDIAPSPLPAFHSLPSSRTCLRFFLGVKNFNSC
jgi:hypothetical protein